MKFIEKLKKDGIEYKNLKNKTEIKQMHKNFYLKVKNDIKKEFYKNNKNNIIIFKYNN